MLKRGDLTRTAVLMAAKDLFSEKGYSAVTMKDFCERNELSRGGLYRHFASTKDIFIAMLNYDRDNSSAELEKAIEDQLPAKQVFAYFIEKQKQEIQNGIGRLSIAIYEFCTTEADQKEYMDKRFTSAVDTLSKLIRYGQSQKVFKSCNSEDTARYIIIFLEGLRLSSSAVTFKEEMIEELLNGIYSMVICNEDKL